MELTDEGIKELDKMMEKFKKFKLEYRKNLPERFKKRSLYVESEYFHDDNYYLTSNSITKEISRAEALDILKEKLDQYYS